MKIRRDITSRIKKRTTLNPELHTPFVQGDFEYVTNKYFMVKVPNIDGKKEDNRKLPIMSITEKSVDSGTGEMRCFDIELLVDALTIMKDNGAKYADMRLGRHGAKLEGLFNYGDKESVASALVMAIAK